MFVFITKFLSLNLRLKIDILVSKDSFKSSLADEIDEVNVGSDMLLYIKDVVSIIILFLYPSKIIRVFLKIKH